MAVFRGGTHLVHAALLITVQAAKPKEGALVTGQAANHVIAHAQRDVGILFFGGDSQQSFGVGFGLAHHGKSRELLLDDDRVVVGFHAVGYGKSEQPMDIVWLGLQEFFGLLAGLSIRLNESGVVVLFRGARDAA